MSAGSTFIRIAKPADDVFAFMANPDKLSLWSFGTWRTQIDAATGIIWGWSIKDGSGICLKIKPYSDVGLIDYLIGSEPDHLVPRIFVRVVVGSVLGGSDEECGLTMTAIRTDDMDEARWRSMIATHIVELDLIKAAIETGYDHRNP